MVKRLMIDLVVCLLLAGAAGAAPRYRVVVLNPPGWGYSYAAGVSGGQQVGSGCGTTGWHACLWSGTPESCVDLHPSGFPASEAEGISDGQQVGMVGSSAFVGHASLWSGTPESWVDLHPNPHFEWPDYCEGSEACGVSGGQQVGTGFFPRRFTSRALLWSGTAESCIDLNPSGFSESWAYGISGGQQVGQGYVAPASGMNMHALLWSGTPESCVDLHPSGFQGSVAYGVSGGQQVGFGYVGYVGGYMIYHALLWSGTAQSCVDLNPTGFIQSEARGVSAGQQVGWGWGSATGGSEHALLWSGTAESCVDLHTFLALAGCNSSIANGIDSSGNIVGTVYYTGGAPSLGDYWQAVMWVPLPPVPVVSTLPATKLPATNATKLSATLNGSMTDDGGEACQYRFRYKDDKSDYLYTVWTGSVRTGEPFSEPITDLKPNATYYFNAQAKNSAGESEWGNEQTFVASPAKAPTASFKSLNVVEKGYPDEKTREDKHMVGGVIRFDPAGSKGTIVKYEWDFRNGRKERTDAPNTYEVTFQDPNIYEVTLTVTDDHGLTDTYVEELDLSLKPGDLIFLRSAWWDIPFIIARQTYTHVGMYIGQQMMIESLAVGNARSDWVPGVVMTRLSDWSYPSETYAIAKRVESAKNDDIRQKAVGFAMSKYLDCQGYDFNLWQ